MLKSLTAQLNDRADLTAEQVAQAISDLTSEQFSVEEKAAFLTALATKGETPEEIAAFAAEMRDRAVKPDVHPSIRQQEILDVCGTGGDRLNTFNISSTVSIIAAAAGVVVAKHGNRAITSQSGSADVLEELGVPINLSPEQAAKSLSEHNFAFFLAPNYHPAFKNIVPARKHCAERGQRTIFNFLGPLLNPVRPTAQLLGVPRVELCEPLARVLQRLGLRRAMVVSGDVGQGTLDELSTLGETTIAEYYHDRGFNSSRMDPAHFGFQAASLDHLRGGDKKANAAILLSILNGQDRGPKRDAVLLNSAAALFVAGKVKSLAEGLEFAAELMDSGKALAKLNALMHYRP